MGNCGNKDEELNKQELEVYDNEVYPEPHDEPKIAKAGFVLPEKEDATCIEATEIENIEKEGEKKENENVRNKYMHDIKSHFDERIKNYGKFSSVENMNNKSEKVVLEVENSESDYLEKDKLERNIHNFDNSKLFYKGVIEFDDGSFYDGTWNLDFKKHGYGKFVKADGSKYVGTFNEDKIEGQGYYIDTKGNIYKGTFQDEKANGQGEIKHNEIKGYFYKGGFFNNKMHGQGEERIPNGTFYKGEFNMGEKEPKGKIIFKDGSSYEGEFRKGEIHGKGKYIWDDGKIYEGEFKNNKTNGIGKTTWPDGSYYEGEYKNDQREGKGTHYIPSGEKYYIGTWMNSLFHGEGEYKDSTTQYKGIWRYGKKIKQFS